MAPIGMTQNCPTTLPGVDVAVADTPKGITLTFTSKLGNVAELQGRVERMTKMHTMISDTARGRGHIIAGEVKYEALPTGARLTLTAKDPARVAEFRTQVRSHEEEMKKGDCAMMENMMWGMTGTMRQPMGK